MGGTFRRERSQSEEMPMEFKMPVLPEGAKPFGLGALAGAVLVAWVGFDALGWKSNSTAETLASRKADTAVVAAYASVCREQFKQGADFPVRLAALEKAERYSRGDAVAKGGWATMTGTKEPHPGVAQACAEMLIPSKT
jgi:hypothetical protein